ncbi:low affinity immunoglobulin gamma Fc region receptor II-like isoform X2, partial [Lates japonicus]
GESPPSWITVTGKPTTTHCSTSSSIITAPPPSSSSPHLSVLWSIPPVCSLAPLVLLVRRCVRRKAKESAPTVRGSEDLTYQQIMIRPNRTREFPAQLEVVYSSLRPIFTPSHQPDH